MKDEKILKHLIGYSFLVALLLGVLVGLSFYGISQPQEIISYLLFGVLMMYPLVLTVLNLIFLFTGQLTAAVVKKSRQIEGITIVLGSVYSVGIASILNIRPYDWEEVLVNQQRHTPIWTGGWITIVVIASVAVAGYLVLSFVKVDQVPPLVVVVAIAAMYMGVVLCVLWIAQTLRGYDAILCLFPFNGIIIAAKTIRYKVCEWESEQQREPKQFRNKYLEKMNQKLLVAKRWPMAAFILMWPLLGLIILILLLFGQQPDSLIKSWTETSDWNLSQRISPPNVYFDEHYLCTVAAGGHAKVVKPIRMGERHGHRVIVNRQLCIANAFEQVIEERTPLFHRRLRNFYDRYGFPVAKLIRSQGAADFVYIVMKPLEWVFLMVLYFCDVHPENRIAVQYLPLQAKKE